MNDFIYARVERSATGSWLTIKLPFDYEWNDVELYVNLKMPGWKVMQTTVYNPNKPPKKYEV